jgi:uncharacterized protein (DUF433 family)
MTPAELSQRITRNPEVLGGKPIIRGTRIAVDLVNDWLESGVSREQILEDYPNLTAEDLEAAAQYRAAHQARIVRYTAEEIDEMLRRGESRSNFERLDALTEEELEASIDFEEGEIDWDTIQVGLPLPKQQLTVRLDAEVIDWFRAGGPGYQSRINAVLRSYVDAKKKAC